jgi:hypothetical protein
MKLRAAVPALVVALLPATPAPAGVLGDLEFPITGTPECQRLFRQGMLEMHSFQYDQAHASFGSALQADAGCAMAAWGDALAYNHPVWSQRDVPKAKAALARVGDASRLTAKERAYLATAGALYDVEDTRAAQQAWLVAAARMHADFPRDDEVALQHALALIAVHGYNKDRQREQSEAGAIALDVLARRPEHPGAAHYVIHAFDNPEHAILALPAARIYARIAPAAGHALHMPSHTFTHLGMWRDVVPSNEQAYSASQAAARALGQSTQKWDWHSYSWLVAAHLELGQAEQARKLVEGAGALLAERDSAEQRSGYADVAGNYVAQTGRWSEAEALAAPLLRRASDEGADGSGPVACLQHAPGGSLDERPPFVHQARIMAHSMRAEAALRAGAAEAAEARAGDIRATVESMKPWSRVGRSSRPVEAALAYAAEVDARARLVRARSPETEQQALAAIENTARVTDSLPISGPAFFLTARERLGEALLAAGRPSEALAQYERVADARNGRALSLLGAARAAHAAGDATRASAHYAALAAQWTDADSDLAAVVEARARAGEGLLASLPPAPR